MSAPSIGGALKAIVVNSSVVSGRIFRSDAVPERPTFPYVTFLDPVDDSPALEGDCATMARFRLVSVDLWQKAKDENFILADLLQYAIDGAVLSSSDVTYGCKVQSMVRLDDEDASIVHHSLTVRVPHSYVP